MKVYNTGSTNFEGLTNRIFFRKDEFSVYGISILSFGLALLTGIAAQIRIPLPFTPVPITGQVLVVLLSGLAFGRWCGGLSQFIYLSLGAAGLPWFARFNGGYSVIAGPTGGYLLGFVVAAWITGWLTDNLSKPPRILHLLATSVIGIGIIYLFGFLWLWCWLGTNFLDAIKYGVIPFFGVDLLKVLIASALASKIAFTKVSRL